MSNDFSVLIAEFGLTTCAASKIGDAIPADAIGVAVVHASSAERETVYLVIDSRAKSLRELCARRLQTANLPAGADLFVSFKITPPADSTPEAIHAACRDQVTIASKLRHALRPSMR